MERKEYLLSELPVELRPYYDTACFGFRMGTVGFTLGGTRYRIYKDEQQRRAAKGLGIDLLDALKGASVPTHEVEAAMDRLGYTPEDRSQTWAEITERQTEAAQRASCPAACVGNHEQAIND